MTSKPSYPRLEFHERSVWRQWLTDNHATASGVWFTYFKKDSGIAGLSYDDAVEEALCFGWIDSRVNTLDEARYIQIFTPRKPKSIWSKLNKARIEKLIAQGLMAAPGLAKIEAAKQDGSWWALDAIESLHLPDDLQTALAADPTAQGNFAALSDSVKKQFLWWIASAKRPQTRADRIAQTVALVAENRLLRQSPPSLQP